MKKCAVIIASIIVILGGIFGIRETNDVKAETNYEDIDKFPESYRQALYALKEKHPNWTFQVMNTGLDWSTVVYNEMNPATRSLVPSYFSSEFVGAYYGDGWSCATEAAVNYYLDPRNWFTEDYIFQFELLSYNAGTQGIATVQKVLANSFMSGYIQSDAQNNYEQMGLTYAQAFSDIGKSIGVSPVHLASRVYQEQGAAGTSELISGTYPGYEGYYNYYNIQATGSNREQIVTNGLNEAKNEGWNSRYAALIGGSQKVANRYILRGQDTLYLQKFDVDGSYDGRYWHQYMQNLAAPSNEGRNMKKAYEKAGMLNEAFVFKIPVYNNMYYQEGFAKANGKTYYYEKGVMVKGEYQIDGKWYYFDTTTGEMLKAATVEINGKNYCYGRDGVKVIGGIGYADGYWHYCENDTGEITMSKYAGDIFNAEDYAKYNQDVVNALGTDSNVLLNHWLEYGVYEGRRPSELYSYEYYSKNYDGITTQFGSSYESVSGHFALFGMPKGYTASYDFNVVSYILCNEDLFRAFGYDLTQYYLHYLNNGRYENRIHKVADNIYENSFMGGVLFDPEVYSQKNDDIKNAFGNDANKLFEHWVTYGVYEGRCASYIYDGIYYMSQYNDIGENFRENYVGAMLHFCMYGMSEFRNGSAEFDVAGYTICNRDLVDAYGENWPEYYTHYCKYGMYEGRARISPDYMNRIFNTEYYVNNYSDVASGYGDGQGAIKHFALYGVSEGRNGNTDFNVYSYKSRYEDLQTAYGDNIAMYYRHFLLWGINEGRISN